MQFDELARRAAASARQGAADAARPAIEEVKRTRRLRSGIGALSGAFVATILLVGVFALVPRGSSLSDVAGVETTAVVTTADSSVTTAPTTETPPETSGPDSGFGGSVWSISHNPAWHRANSELMPNLGWESVTLATFPLRPGGSRCAHLPENALRDLGPEDVLVTAFFTGESFAGDAAPWPATGFDDTVLPLTGPNDDVPECSERPELEVHWGLVDNAGEAIYLLAAFGDDVADDVRAQAWSALSSIELIDAGDQGNTCVVTVPTQPGLAVPDTHPAVPVFGLWYGTTDLWTVLEETGTYGPRKSVWWSANFPGGDVEERPAISVVWRRLDADEPDIVSDRGTNAMTAEDGWFMISGIDPAVGGCWEITATYKGATLSHVALIDG